MDSAVASAVVALLAMVHSAWWLLAYALTAAVCWSRVVLRDHTTAQTVAGASLGAATATAFLVACPHPARRTPLVTESSGRAGWRVCRAGGRRV